MSLNEGTFGVFMAGQYNTNTKAAFEATKQSGSCASYVSFHNMTHFGMNDYVRDPDLHQVVPFSLAPSLLLELC